MINKFKTEELGIGFDFDVEFEENQKVNCIIGKNGIGKTQLLESMAKSLIYTHSIFLVNGNYQYKNYFIQKDILEKTKDLELKIKFLKTGVMQLLNILLEIEMIILFLINQ